LVGGDLSSSDEDSDDALSPLSLELVGVVYAACFSFLFLGEDWRLRPEAGLEARPESTDERREVAALAF